MKKKTKLIGAIFALCTSLCMLVVGVLAASQVSLNVSSSVSFEASGVYVKAKGEVQKGNDTTEPTRASEPSGSDYYYIGYSYDAQDEEQESDTLASDYNDTPVGTSSYTPMTTWTIGEVEFSETENIIRYSLTFTNYSEKDIQATITTNKDTFMQDPDVQGKVEIEETSTSIIIGGYDGTAQTGTYTISMKLTDFSSSFASKSLTIDVNFLTNTVNYDYFNIQDNVITGLSDEYKNLETKPEVLIIPGKSKEGNVPLSIGAGDEIRKISTFNGLSSSIVIIKEGLTSIGSWAFRNCSNLTSITIPEGVTSIEDSTFDGCSSLTSITIPEGVTSIGSSAFHNCSSLKSVTVPSSVTSMGAYAFDLCSSLKYIHLQGNLNSSYSLSGTWVKTNDANEPSSWTPTVKSMQTAGYYHQQSAWESAT